MRNHPRRVATVNIAQFRDQLALSKLLIDNRILLICIASSLYRCGFMLDQSILAVKQQAERQWFIPYKAESVSLDTSLCQVLDSRWMVTEIEPVHIDSFKIVQEHVEGTRHETQYRYQSG